MATKRKPITIQQSSRKKNGGTNLPALPADLMAEMAKDATDASANARVFGESNFISIKGGVFTYKNQNLGKEIDTVILASANLNEYYAKAYDGASKGQTPSCYALSVDGLHMAPHSASPKKEGTTCDECWASKFGTAAVGKGRACKQKVRIAIFHADDIQDAETAQSALICTIGVPAMSVSNFGSYVKVLAGEHKIPTYAGITRIVLESHPQWQTEMKFIPISSLTDPDVIKVVMGRVRTQARDLVLAPFPSMKADKEESKGKSKRTLPGQPKTGPARGGRSRFSQ